MIEMKANVRQKRLWVATLVTFWLAVGLAIPFLFSFQGVEIRLYDIAESLRDLVGSALDTYLSVVNNRMNEVMKILTVITTLFMPLSFMTGFFGMNFFQPVTPLAAWTDRLAFGLVLAAMGLIPAGMYVWMRRRAWT